MQTAEARISASAFADTKPPLRHPRRTARRSLTVVCFHLFEAYATSHLDQRINHGYLAVDFFFILSGFVVGYAYDDRWRRMSVGEFLKRRLIRLQPMVVIGALIGAAMFYTQGCSVWDVSKVTVAALLAATLMNALMIPRDARRRNRGVGEMYPLNGPSWSLFFSISATSSTPSSLRRLPTRALAAWVALAGCGLAAFALWGALRRYLRGIRADGRQHRGRFAAAAVRLFGGSAAVARIQTRRCQRRLLDQRSGNRRRSGRAAHRREANICG